MHRLARLLAHAEQGGLLPVDLKDAEGWLEFLDSTTDLLSLFAHYFPAEFAQARAENLSLFPAPGARYSPLELRFFQLVDRHLFPLPLWLCEDGYFGERGLAYIIPIEGIGFEPDRDDDLALGWQLVLYLVGQIEQDDLRQRWPDLPPAFFAIPVAGTSVDVALFALRCQAQGGPLAWLPLALDMLSNDTESVWLNVTYEQPCTDIGWTRAEVDELHRHYLLALEIKRKAETLCAWLEADPCAHFLLAACLWNTCARDWQERPPSPPGGRTLLAAWSEVIYLEEHPR